MPGARAGNAGSGIDPADLWDRWRREFWLEAAPSLALQFEAPSAARSISHSMNWLCSMFGVRALGKAVHHIPQG
jgi:hypothetical protein